VLLPSINNLLVHEHVEEKLIAWTADLLDFTDKTFFLSLSLLHFFFKSSFFFLLLFSTLLLSIVLYIHMQETRQTPQEVSRKT